MPAIVLDADLPPADAGSDAAAAGTPPDAGEADDAAAADGTSDTPPATPAPTFPACDRPPCINVLNNCPVPLWTHAIGTVPLDDGLVRRLWPGERFQYAGLPLFGGGRLYAYYKEPAVKQDRVRLVADYNQFVEMTVDTDTAGTLHQNYNISYVDYAALPVWMQARGDGCRATTCGLSLADWTARLARCPTELRDREGTLATCLGSYGYCISGDRDQSLPYCRKMHDAHGFPGSAIYGGVFPDHPATDVAFWDRVAAWNRGAAPGDADDSHYYLAEPFNHYARWIHRELGCRQVYAFSTDDHQDQAGFVRCPALVLDVVWCPGDEGRVP